MDGYDCGHDVPEGLRHRVCEFCPAARGIRYTNEAGKFILHELNAHPLSWLALSKQIATLRLHDPQAVELDAEEQPVPPK
jgi:hypothetical protein